MFLTAQTVCQHRPSMMDPLVAGTDSLVVTVRRHYVNSTDVESAEAGQPGNDDQLI